MADDLDVEAMLEAPYRKEVSIVFSCYKFNALFESLFRVLVVVSLVFFQCQVSSLCDPGYEAKFSEDGLSSLCFERCQCQQDILFRFITTISTF